MVKKTTVPGTELTELEYIIKYCVKENKSFYFTDDNEIHLYLNSKDPDLSSSLVLDFETGTFRIDR